MKKRALILCHPKNLTDDLSGHFLGKLFKELQYTFFPNEEFEYHTVDISEIGYDSKLGNVHTVHYQADAWSPEFLNRYKEQYAMVFMPDCGGIWHTNVLQQKEFEDALGDIITRTMTLVSDPGILFLGKFLPAHESYINKKYTNASLHHSKPIWNNGNYQFKYFIFRKPVEKDENTIKLIDELLPNGYTIEQIAEMLDEPQKRILWQTVGVRQNSQKLHPSHKVDRKASEKETKELIDSLFKDGFEKDQIADMLDESQISVLFEDYP